MTLSRDLQHRVSTLTNILLVAPSMEASTTETCVDLLTVPDPADTNVLYVTYTDAPDSVLARWTDSVETLPASVRVIPVSSVAAPTASSGRVAVDPVSEPGNLTDLGVAITDAFEAWAPSDRRTVLCFRSLTALLQYVDRRPAYRFLHTVTRHVQESGSLAHFHMEPNAHDEETVTTFTTLFDGVLDLDAEDTWRLRTS